MEELAEWGSGVILFNGASEPTFRASGSRGCVEPSNLRPGVGGLVILIGAVEAILRSRKATLRVPSALSVLIRRARGLRAEASLASKAK
jgi:hypothetical protein